MYLICDENGGIEFTKELDKVDYDSSDAGLDTIISITNPNKPSVYVKGDLWHELTERKGWCGYGC